MEKKHKAGQKSNFLSSLTDAMSTHPPSEERVKQMRKMSSEESVKPSMIRSTKQFEEIRKVCKEYTLRAQTKKS